MRLTGESPSLVHAEVALGEERLESAVRVLDVRACALLAVDREEPE